MPVGAFPRLVPQLLAVEADSKMTDALAAADELRALAVGACAVPKVRPNGERVPVLTMQGLPVESARVFRAQVVLAVDAGKPRFNLLVVPHASLDFLIH